MARRSTAPVNMKAFMEDDEAGPEGAATPEVTEGDQAGVEGDNTLPPAPASDAESDAGAEPEKAPAEAPEAPPAEAAAAPEAEEVEGVHTTTDPKTGLKLPSWKSFKEVIKEKDALAAEKAALAAEKETIAQERERERQQLAQLQAWQQQQLLMQQRAQQPQQQEVPGVTRPFNQQELLALREQDPIAYGQYMGEMAYQQSMQLQQQQQAYQRQMEVQMQSQAFRQQQPDYDQALEFLNQRERAMARTMKIDEDQWVEFRASQLVHLATQQGMSIPQTAYAIAREWGYTPAQAEAVAQAAAAAPQGAPAPVTPQQRVQQSIARTQATATALGTTGGSVGTPGKISRAEYLAMPEEQEMEMEAKYGPDWVDKMVDVN